MTDAEIVTYDHCDADDLRTKLEAQSESGPQKKWLIATDSVFSMDGTIAPLDEICTLADEYDAWVMADEAHATGIYGDEGGGIVDRMDLHDQVDIQMGTLSKALASQGGYIAGDESLIEYLQTASRTFLFSAGLNPPAAAAARKALEIARESDLRTQLFENVAYLRNEIEAVGFETWGEAHIVPVIIGDPATTTEFARRMKERGILIHDVPYPAVEHGTDRLRLIPTADHTQDELERTVTELASIGSTMDIIDT